MCGGVWVGEEVGECVVSGGIKSGRGFVGTGGVFDDEAFVALEGLAGGTGLEVDTLMFSARVEGLGSGVGEGEGEPGAGGNDLGLGGAGVDVCEGCEPASSTSSCVTTASSRLVK